MVRVVDSAVTNHTTDAANIVDEITPMKFGRVFLAELALAATSFVEVLAEGLALPVPGGWLAGGDGASGLCRAPGVTSGSPTPAVRSSVPRRISRRWNKFP